MDNSSNNTPKIIAGVIAVLFIVIALFVAGGGDDDGDKGTSAANTNKAPKGSVVVSVAYSPEKDPLLVPAIKRFNDEGREVDGKKIYVEGINVSSGAAFDQIRKGDLKPTIWTPSSSFWGKLLTESGSTYVLDDNPSFVRTPLVLAMWEEQAKVLGWPGKQLGWSDVMAWSRNPGVFRDLGRPEWGDFRMGHTNPDFSTSGLSAVAAQYYAAAGKSEGLTVEDLDKPGVRETVRDLQSSVVHYGDTTLFFADQMRLFGPSYASLVAMEEVTLIDFNQKRKGGPKLVAIYPKEGTFFSDNPLMTLDAPWSSEAEKKAAKEFTDYLLTPKFQATVGKIGMRPSIEGVDISPEISAKNGVDPEQPLRVNSVPAPAVLAKIKGLWQLDRKPADVALVFDVSGSMLDENKMVEAQAGLVKFLAQVAPQDRVALIAFSDKPTRVLGLTEMTPKNRKEMIGRVKGLFADGGTSVYDATLDGVDMISKEGDDKHIKAVVVLTDGMDTNSQNTAKDVIKHLSRGSESSSHDVRVFTIAYGSGADVSTLGKIAEAGGGKAYEGDPKTIDQVYTSISSFF